MEASRIKTYEEMHQEAMQEVREQATKAHEAAVRMYLQQRLGLSWEEIQKLIKEKDEEKKKERVKEKAQNDHKVSQSAE